MEAYEQHMKDNFTLEERQTIAQFQEGQQEWAKAAHHYVKCNKPQKALKLFFNAGEQYIPKMIDLVVDNKQTESLTQSLIDYITGEFDN